VFRRVVGWGTRVKNLKTVGGFPGYRYAPSGLQELLAGP
jgi:hypothetical protein